MQATEPLGPTKTAWVPKGEDDIPERFGGMSLAIILGVWVCLQPTLGNFEFGRTKRRRERKTDMGAGIKR